MSENESAPGRQPEAPSEQPIDGLNIAHGSGASSVYRRITPDLACRFHAAGLSVLRVKEDGSKEPVGKWKQYQAAPATTAQLRAWFTAPSNGIGAVMGRVSNTELFEFDDWQAYIDFKALVTDYGYGELIDRIEQGYCERTPGGGIHWYYHCQIITGSTKLAQRPAPTSDNPRGVKTLIETKGEGGYSVMAPSGGPVHETGGSYEVIAGSVETIADITSDERDLLHAFARSFDKMPAKEIIPPAAARPRIDGYLLPGEDFNARADWFMDVLQGWTPVFRVGQTTYIRRPGKNHGHSASINFTGNDTLIVFSTSTIFETSPVSYSKFAAYTFLNHQGDFKAAAKALRQLGYGSQAEPPPLPEPPEECQKQDAFSGDHWCDWRSAFFQLVTYTRDILKSPDHDATDKCILLANELPRWAASPCLPDDGFDPDDETDFYTTYKVLSRRTAFSTDTCARHLKGLQQIDGSPYRLTKLPGMGKPRPDARTGEMVPTALTILECDSTAAEDLKFFAKCRRPDRKQHGGGNKGKQKQVALVPPAVDVICPEDPSDDRIREAWEVVKCSRHDVILSMRLLSSDVFEAGVTSEKQDADIGVHSPQVAFSAQSPTLTLLRKLGERSRSGKPEQYERRHDRHWQPKESEPLSCSPSVEVFCALCESLRTFIDPGGGGPLICSECGAYEASEVSAVGD